ncbi:MAG: hypothetical protein JNK82_28200 [Myxococcaceae bacterium]|nr:hypothetical protein [Myxococcaceae bacterium]
MHPTPNADMMTARRTLKRLGLAGPDIYLAELIPAVEMAWADGSIHPSERALLEAYCDQLVAHLNVMAGAPVFSGKRARAALDHMLSRRLLPHERHEALLALKVRASQTAEGAQMVHRLVEWTEAVGAVAGQPAWDTRELFWLQTVLRILQVEQ